MNTSDLGKKVIEVDWDYYLKKMDDIEIKELLARNIDYLTELDKKSTKASLKISNNKVISHRDLDLPNILWDNKDNGGNISDLEDAIFANFKNKSGWLEYNMKRVCRIECLDEEEQKLGKKEVIRVINEIVKFYEIIENFKLEDYK